MKPAPPPTQTLAPLPGGRVKGRCSDDVVIVVVVLLLLLVVGLMFFTLVLWSYVMYYSQVSKVVSWIGPPRAGGWILAKDLRDGGRDSKNTR